MPFQNYSLHQLGWRPQYARELALDDFEAGYPARVTALRHGDVSLLSSRGAGTAALAWHLAGAGIVPGDWVMVERASGRVSTLLPRHSLLAPAAAGTPRRPAAANLDTVFVTGTVGPGLDMPRLQRDLALARAAGIAPVLVLDGVGRTGDAPARLDALRRWLPVADAVALDGADPCAATRLAPWLEPGCTVAFLGGAPALSARLAATGMRHGTMIATAGGAWVVDMPASRPPLVCEEPEACPVAPVKRVASAGLAGRT